LKETIVVAQKKFYEKYPNLAYLTPSAVDEWISKVVDKVKIASHSKLKKKFPLDTTAFLEQMKFHYQIHDESPKMTQDKLWMLATLAMDTSM